MKLYIPRVGEIITLSKVWTFNLYLEDRNQTLWEAFNFKWPDKWPWRSEEFKKVRIPKGAQLKIDRVYLRKGDKESHEYDSITFIWQNAPEEMIRERKSFFDSDNAKKIKIKKHRFWAKLDDVNKIEIIY